MHHVYAVFAKEHGVSLCSISWPRTLYVALAGLELSYVDQAGPELTQRVIPACAGINGMCHHAQKIFIFVL